MAAPNAREYANSPQTDPATFFGMREAMASAVLDLKGKSASGNIAEAAKDSLDKAVDGNSLLKAAGTQELVKRYFHEVVDRQGNDKDSDIKAFLDDIRVSKSDVDAARAGKLSDEQLASLGSSFLKSAKAHLGIQTLTEDFRKEISGKESLTRDISITPSVLAPELADSLAKMESTFRLADKLDATLFGNPQVSHLLAHTDPDVEKTLSPIIAAATRLRDGTSEKPMDDVKFLRQESARITGKDNGVSIQDQPSPEETRKIGEQALDWVVKLRSGQSSQKETDPVRKADASQSQPGMENPMDMLMQVIVAAVQDIEKMVSGGKSHALSDALAASMSGNDHASSAHSVGTAQAPATRVITSKNNGIA